VLRESNRTSVEYEWRNDGVDQCTQLHAAFRESVLQENLPLSGYGFM
jgi:hypothetical protein